MAVSKQISPRLLKLLNKKYPSKRNFTVDDARKIQKSLGGTRVPVYSKDGGYIVKKRKKTVKKRKK
jgi:hypothetical protein